MELRQTTHLSRDYQSEAGIKPRSNLVPTDVDGFMSPARRKVSGCRYGKGRKEYDCIGVGAPRSARTAAASLTLQSVAGRRSPLLMVSRASLSITPRRTLPSSVPIVAASFTWPITAKDALVNRWQWKSSSGIRQRSEFSKSGKRMAPHGLAPRRMACGDRRQGGQALSQPRQQYRVSRRREARALSR